MRIPTYSSTQAITTNEATTPAAATPAPSAAQPTTLAEDNVQLSSATQQVPQQNDNEIISINGTAKGNDRPPV